MSNVVKEKSFEFAVRVVNLYSCLCKEKKEYGMSRQLLRSGPAIGALVRESEQAESKADFVHKLSMTLKEANETDYWISWLSETKFLKPRERKSILSDNPELLKLLISIIKSTKARGTDE